ncbi:hypothetical protein [Streptomyces virginiae]|uniref:hypothetical protein n=1 Tax=Streptomyces virginiae TaxID=1961 RepID=UPI00386F33DB
MLAQTREEVLRPGLARLSDDLPSGLWHERHADLLNREPLDIGYRLVIADLSEQTSFTWATISTVFEEVSALKRAPAGLVVAARTAEAPSRRSGAPGTASP